MRRDLWPILRPIIDQVGHIEVVRRGLPLRRITSILIIPRRGIRGIPISLQATGEEVVVRAGVAGRLTLRRDGRYGDEPVRDVVAAIIGGEATERYWVDDSGEVTGALSIRAARGAHVQDTGRKVVASWPLPAWSET